MTYWVPHKGAGHILTSCVVLRSPYWRATTLCPWSRTSLRFWVQRSLYKHCKEWRPFSYFTPTCPAISLPPHPSFPFFHRGVLFHVTLATQRLCSALHSAGIRLPWRADALCLSSCHPHQKKAHVDGSIKPLFNLHTAWDVCRHPEHKIKCYQIISVFYFLFIFPAGIYLSLYMNLKLHCKDSKPYSEWGLRTSL